MGRKSDPEKAQALHDKFEDWGPDPKGKFSYMQFSPTAKRYWCQEHRLLLEPGPAGNHAKEHIKIKKLEGVTGDPSKLNAADRRYLELAKQQAQKDSEIPEEILSETTSQMLIDSISKAWTDEMAGLVKDPQIIYGYFRLHDEGLLPYDWGIGTFLKACFKEWMENYHIIFEMNVDMEKMSEKRQQFITSTIEENREIRQQLKDQSEFIEPETTTEEKDDQK